MTDHTLIIAEAGVNHNGDFQTAKRLVDAAKDAGADYVKFQTFKSENLVSKFAKKADYQKKNIDSLDDSQYSMLKKLELTKEQHEKLVGYCKQKGIKFLSTAFDLESIDFLKNLNIGLWKIPSGEVTNYPYLRKIASFNELTILSTGMCDLKDVKDAMSVLTSMGLSRDKITILHCTTEYPAPIKEVNLRAMQTMAKYFGVKVGYSDHTEGIEIPIAAVAMGASVIEKHFTLDRNMKGPDHKASIEPNELKEMVCGIKNVKMALGTGNKIVTESEKKNIIAARKSIVAACSIKRGDVYTEQNLTTKRPGSGISPMLWESVLGKYAKRDFNKDELIEL